jgi:beta-galactosidase beta subunit
MAKGFEFINNHLATMEPGVYEIESKSIFALFKSTKEIKDCVLEGHVKYIDIQYIIQGVELMGVTTKKIKSNN